MDNINKEIKLFISDAESLVCGEKPVLSNLNISTRDLTKAPFVVFAEEMIKKNWHKKTRRKKCGI